MAFGGDDGMTRRKWLPLVVLFMLPGVATILLVLGLAAYFILGQSSPTQTFEVRDPNSPTVVRIVGGPEGCNCVISADGRRRTQYAGWPKDQIAEGAEPTAVVWHGDPDWVEIVLSSGERLKLTWDTDAVERARASRESHYFLNPRYQVLPRR
jgi:hypothetical protein